MDFIRFLCPACSTSLTVPPAAAGFQGPCPKCAVEIIGPNPSLGLAASLPLVEAPAKAFDPFPEASHETAAPAPVDPAPELIPPTDPFAGIAPASGPSDFKRPEPLPVNEPPAPEVPPAPDPVMPELPEEVAGKTEEPFKDFTPPSPQPKPVAPSIPQAPPSSARPSVAVLVLSCLLCGVVAFVAGYTFGRRIPEASGPAIPTKPDTSSNNTPPAPPPEPIPIPVRTWIPDAKPLEPSEPETTGPEATLQAFLDADGWASRSAYVMFPETIRARMEARSKVSDDGPIETTSVSLFEVNERTHVFKVATPQIPEGFPVAVTRDNHGWLIDWDGFVEFHDDRFRRFAAGQEGERGHFHLLVKPVESNNEESLFEQFQLNPPMPGRQQTAYIGKGTVALARMQSIFDRQAGLSGPEFNKLLEGKGPPMVLALSFKTNAEGQSFLQIDDVVAIGWGPGNP